MQSYRTEDGTEARFELPHGVPGRGQRIHSYPDDHSQQGFSHQHKPGYVPFKPDRDDSDLRHRWEVVDTQTKLSGRETNFPTVHHVHGAVPRVGRGRKTPRPWITSNERNYSANPVSNFQHYEHRLRQDEHGIMAADRRGNNQNTCDHVDAAQYDDPGTAKDTTIITVYVAGIPKGVIEADLKSLFSIAGVVRHVKKYPSKRAENEDFGFVGYSSLDEAKRAIRVLHNHKLQGCCLRVQLSRKSAQRHTDKTLNSATSQKSVPHQMGNIQVKQEPSDDMAFKVPGPLMTSSSRVISDVRVKEEPTDNCFSEVVQGSPKELEYSSMVTVYVAGIPKCVIEDDLKNLFSIAGVVRHVKKYPSKRAENEDFGFVGYSSLDEAKRAIRVLHNHKLQGCRLRVQLSRKSAQKHTDKTLNSATSQKSLPHQMGSVQVKQEPSDDMAFKVPGPLMSSSSQVISDVVVKQEPTDDCLSEPNTADRGSSTVIPEHGSITSSNQIQDHDPGPSTPDTSLNTAAGKLRFLMSLSIKKEPIDDIPEFQPEDRQRRSPWLLERPLSAFSQASIASFTREEESGVAGTPEPTRRHQQRRDIDETSTTSTTRKGFQRLHLGFLNSQPGCNERRSPALSTFSEAALSDKDESILSQTPEPVKRPHEHQDSETGSIAQLTRKKLERLHVDWLLSSESGRNERRSPPLSTVSGASRSEKREEEMPEPIRRPRQRRESENSTSSMTRQYLDRLRLADLANTPRPEHDPNSSGEDPQIHGYINITPKVMTPEPESSQAGTILDPSCSELARETAKELQSASELGEESSPNRFADIDGSNPQGGPTGAPAGQVSFTTYRLGLKYVDCMKGKSTPSHVAGRLSSIKEESSECLVDCAETEVFVTNAPTVKLEPDSDAASWLPRITSVRSEAVPINQLSAAGIQQDHAGASSGQATVGNDSTLRATTGSDWETPPWSLKIEAAYSIPEIKYEKQEFGVVNFRPQTPVHHPVNTLHFTNPDPSVRPRSSAPSVHQDEDWGFERLSIQCPVVLHTSPAPTEAFSRQMLFQQWRDSQEERVETPATTWPESETDIELCTTGGQNRDDSPVAQGRNIKRKEAPQFKHMLQEGRKKYIRTNMLPDKKTRQQLREVEDGFSGLQLSIGGTSQQPPHPSEACRPSTSTSFRVPYYARPPSQSIGRPVPTVNNSLWKKKSPLKLKRRLDGEEEACINEKVQKLDMCEIGWGANVFRGWLREQGFSPYFESCSVSQLDELLMDFYGSVQVRMEGRPQTEVKMVSLRASIHRHLTGAPYHLHIDIMDPDGQFKRANAAFRHALHKLHELREKRFKLMAEPDPVVLVASDLRKLLRGGYIGTHAPLPLFRKVFIDLNMYFVKKNKAGIRKMWKTVFIFRTDEHGYRYACLGCLKRIDKCDSVVSGSVIWSGARMYAQPGDPLCPVTSLKLFLSKLSPEYPSLFQRPKNYLHSSEEEWFYKSTMGIDTFTRIMEIVSEKAGLQNTYSTASLHLTALEALQLAGIRNRMICYCITLPSGVHPKRHCSCCRRNIARAIHMRVYNNR